MEIVSKILFGIANSMLVPDIVLLIIFFIRAIVMIVATYNAYTAHRTILKRLGEHIQRLTTDTLPQLRDLMPKRTRTLFTTHLAELLDRGCGQDFADYLLTHFEIEAEKDLGSARMLAKIGPILGLIGTLVAMSPALVGLSAGDITGMAFNMQVVFSTTVVGLLISAVGIVALQLKQRWYATDANNLDYIARIINQQSPLNHGHEASQQTAETR